MAAKYRAGATLQEIGDYYGLTRERVRQLMTKHLGFNRKSGGAAQRARIRRASTELRRDQSYLLRFGVTRADYIQANCEPAKNPARRGLAIERFVRQRNNARPRGIAWNLTFGEWWSIWRESGKWASYGRGKTGYVMARHGDLGPYAPGNVKIISAVENQSEYIRRYWKDVRSGKRSKPALPTRKTHCKRGHEFSDENVYVTPKNGERTCRECQRARKRKYLQAKKARL